MLRKLLRKTPLAWLQLTRNKVRFIVALSGIAFADILMFVQMGFEGALLRSRWSSRIWRICLCKRELAA
jgi:putative ABC transport system permease protein